MWNKDGKSQEHKAVIPDKLYAGIYAATIDFVKKKDLIHVYYVVPNVVD
jgi:isocitrate dehydrogenase